MKKYCFLLTFLLVSRYVSAQQNVPFTLEDRDRLIKIEQKLAEMEKRFDERLSQMEKRFDERFIQMEKRMDEMRADMNARFEQQYTFFWIFASIFTAMLVAVFGFAYWDRKTYLKPIENRVALLEKLAENELKSKETSPNVWAVLKDFAKIDSRLAEILKQYNIL
ncbi:MAG: hypothetical protein NZ516_11550 [Raineya sp.]|nr:hypothetical protein [Raineya sp.]